MDGSAPARCRATNKDGSACNAKPGAGGLCRWHDPANAERVAAGRRKGGSARSNANRAKRRYAADVLTLRETQGLLSSALRDVLSGEIEPGVASAAAAVARAIATVAQQGDLEERLTALEAAAGIERTA